MEQVPIVAKKLWKLVRVVYFLLRKGISKGKLLADLTMMIKRGKIAGKTAMHNLIFPQHHNHNATNYTSNDEQLAYPVPLNEYEFSCSNTPAHQKFLKKRKNNPKDEDLMAAALQMVINSASASPALPGFGSTPLVRQLRITDSPYPLRDADVDNNHVDEAAEEFIMRFYKDLRRQNKATGY